MNLLFPMFLSYLVLKQSTVLEFTISSVKLFHLLIVRTQNELSLKVFKALGFLSFFELRVWGSENSNKPSIGMSSVFCIILKTCIISIILFRRYSSMK